MNLNINLKKYPIFNILFTLKHKKKAGSLRLMSVIFLIDGTKETKESGAEGFDRYNYVLYNAVDLAIH